MWDAAAARPLELARIKGPTREREVLEAMDERVAIIAS
jgi:hypothetical protein